MQAAIDDNSSGDMLQAPKCGGCSDSEGVAPAVHAYRGDYFCIHCCNYLDVDGQVVVS